MQVSIDRLSRLLPRLAAVIIGVVSSLAIDVTLHEGDLAALRNSASYKNAQALPEFGKDAFVSPNFQEYADLYAKKGNLIVRVTLPMGPKSVETAKSIARKALARM